MAANGGLAQAEQEAWCKGGLELWGKYTLCVTVGHMIRNNRSEEFNYRFLHASGQFCFHFARNMFCSEMFQLWWGETSCWPQCGGTGLLVLNYKSFTFLLGWFAMGPTMAPERAETAGRAWQRLIHLASRAVAFRQQFIRWFLTQPTDLMWRDVASCIYRRVSNL